MTAWNIFKFEDPRPERQAQLDESHRPVLEQQVSLYVSRLLRFFGSIEEVEVDNSPLIGVDCSLTFEVLALDRTELLDGSELLVEQIPETRDGYRTKPGLHTVAHHSDDNDLLRGYSVWDIAANVDPPVTDADGTRVQLDELVELCDALIVITNSYENQENPIAVNDPSHESIEFPRRAVDPIFSAIVDG